MKSHKSFFSAQGGPASGWNLAFAILFLGLFFGWSGKASAATFFVDNETTCGTASDPTCVRTGLDWEHPANSIYELKELFLASMPPENAPVDYYIKANDTPYYERLGHELFDFEVAGRVSRIYLDAVGVGNARGVKKAIVDGRELLTGGVDIGSGLYVYDAASAFVLNSTSSGKTWGVWVDFVPYTKVSSLIGMVDGQWHYNSTTKVLTIKSTSDLLTSEVRVNKFWNIAEIWSREEIHGGIFQYGFNGIGNGGCWGWTIRNCISRNNFYAGYQLVNGYEFNNNIAYGNGADGLSIFTYRDLEDHPEYFGFTHTKVHNNIIYNNGGNGLHTIGRINAYNNTILNNSGHGIDFFYALNAPSTDIVVSNNIAAGNILEQFYCENNMNLTLTASNNNPGTTNQYGGKWEANKGLGNIELDPLFVNPSANNFTLQNISPAINAGTDVGLTSDFDGNPKSGANWDIGAYEFQDSAAPTTTTNISTGTYNSTQNVIFTCNDAIGVGCDKIYYTTDGTNPATSSTQYSTPIQITETTTLKYFSVDLNGNSESINTKTYTIDTTNPIITINPYATQTTDQDITVTASTNEGTLNTTTHTFTENGSFDFIATDQAGNQTIQTVTITNIDKTPKTVASIKPKLFFNDNRKSFSTTLKSDKVKLKNTNPEIANGKVQIKKGDRIIKEVSVDGDGKWSTTFSSKKFRLHYLNQEGAEIATSKEYELKIDDEKPKIKTLAPLYVKHRGSVIDWEASDSKGIDHYTVKFENKTYRVKDSQIKVPSSVKKGAQTFIITAYDKAGNKAFRKGNLVVSW